MNVKSLIEDWESRREEDQKRFETHFPETDDLLAVVLRGHLLLEEFLDWLNRHCFHFPEYYDEARLPFSKKLLIVRAQVLVPNPSPDVFFDCIKKLNEIRNDLAHNLESPKLENKVDGFLKAVESGYNKELLSCHPPESKSREKRTGMAIAYLLGQMQILDNIVEFMEKSRYYGEAQNEPRSAK